MGIVVPGIAVGGCARESRDLSLENQAPQMPDDVDLALDRAIDTTREVESAELSVQVGLGSPQVSANIASAEFHGEWNRDGVGQVSGESNNLGHGLEFEIRAGDELAWLRIDNPLLTGVLPTGVRWVVASVDDLRDANVLTEFDDVWRPLPFIRGMGSFVDGGIERVDGEPVRIVRGVIEYDRAYDAASAQERVGMDETFGFGAPIISFDAEVGLDGQGRVRILDLDARSGSGDGNLAMTHTLSLRVSSFNHQVDEPEIPSSDETVSVDDIPGGLDTLTAALQTSP